MKRNLTQIETFLEIVALDKLFTKTIFSKHLKNRFISKKCTYTIL